jgi:hypothetical protein
VPWPALRKPAASPRGEHLGPAIAYLALNEGTPVYDRNGDRIGVVEIAEIHERGVLLSVDNEELRDPLAWCFFDETFV